VKVEVASPSSKEGRNHGRRNVSETVTGEIELILGIIGSLSSKTRFDKRRQASEEDRQSEPRWRTDNLRQAAEEDRQSEPRLDA
jgi:hypothetical protein